MTTSRTRIARLVGGRLDDAYRSGALRELVGEEPEHRHIDRRTLGQEAPALLDPSGPRRIPVYNRLSAGGRPQVHTDKGLPAGVADEYIWVSGIVDPDAFALRVVGDSMEPEYYDGDIAVFQPNLSAVSGQDCYVSMVHDEESTFKRVFFEHEDREDGVLTLHPLNPKYRDRRYAREDIASMAVCSLVQRRPRRSD